MVNMGPRLVPGVNGTIVGSAVGLDHFGDPVNTGWAVLQPTNYLATTNLPANSVQGYFGPMTGLPYLNLDVVHKAGDGISFTVGYICCANNCLQVQCSSNKMVPCDSTNWTFDVPTATTCCTNNIPGTTTNLSITPISTVTNGVCPPGQHHADLADHGSLQQQQHLQPDGDCHGLLHQQLLPRAHNELHRHGGQGQQLPGGCPLPGNKQYAGGRPDQRVPDGTEVYWNSVKRRRAPIRQATVPQPGHGRSGRNQWCPAKGFCW